MSLEDEDWLALEEKLPAAAAAPAPPAPAPVLDPRRAQAARLKRLLTLEQRRYARHLLAARGNLREAERLYKADGGQRGAATLAKWRTQPTFRQVMDLQADLALEAAGVRATKVLAAVDALADYGAETVTRRNKYGQALKDEAGQEITAMRDPDLAMKANEFLGRHFKLWGDGDNRKSVVLIVDLTGTQQARQDPRDVIEGEVEDVTPGPTGG